MGAIGLLRVVSNQEMIAKERSAQVSLDQAAGPMMGLARHLMQRWSAASRAKGPIETQMLAMLRQRNGLYETGKLQEIRQMGGSEIFMMLTSSKCRALQAILGDVALPDAEYPFEMKATPIPSLPGPVEQAVLQQVYKEAATAGWQINDDELSTRMELLKKMATERLRDLADETAARMGTRIYDQLLEGGWYTAMKEFLYDFATFKAGIIKGPTLRRRKRLSWGQVGDRWTPVTKEEVIPEFDRRSPFNIYPSPRSRGPQHSYLFDKYEFTREELQRMKGTPGFSSDTIDEALYWYGEKGYETPQFRRYELGVLEERPLERLDPEGPLETLNYWGSASGKMLLEWSRDGWRQDIDPNAEYQIESWQLGRYIIKAVVNPDPLGRKPYSKASFEEIPGTFWGKGLPEVLADVQDQCNGAARAMANNLSISSGPQCDISIDRLADGAKITQLFPWKIHQTVGDPSGQNTPAIRFYQPDSHTQELMAVYSFYERIADNVSNIPKYSYGDSAVGGAGRTASGLSMLMGSADKGFEDLVKRIDTDVTEQRLQHLYEFNMEHDPDPTIKGDLRLNATGVRSLKKRQQMQQRRMEMLQATANPVDMQIMGMDGRRELLRETIKSAELPADKIVKSQDLLDLDKANLPQPYEMMGKSGPNAPGGGQGDAGPMGMTPGGGTPAAPQTLDQAGAPVAGQDTRQFNQG